MRADLELSDDEDLIWQQIHFESGSLVLEDLGQIEDCDIEAVMFAVFPRLYVTFQGEEDPGTQGVLFMRSHTQSARVEEKSAKISKPARNGSIRHRLLRNRRPSNDPDLAQV